MTSTLVIEVMFDSNVNVWIGKDIETWDYVKVWIAFDILSRYVLIFDIFLSKTLIKYHLSFVFQSYEITYVNII